MIFLKRQNSSDKKNYRRYSSYFQCLDYDIDVVSLAPSELGDAICLISQRSSDRYCCFPYYL